MGNGIGDVEKESLVSIFPHEFQRILGEQVVRILTLRAAPVSVQEHLLPVPPEIHGIVAVRPALVQIAEPFIEPLFVGDPGCLRIANPPFSCNAGGISGLFQDFRHGHIVGFQRHPALGRAVIEHQLAPDPAHVSAYGGMSQVLTGHQDTPGGRTHRSPGITLGKPHSLLGQLVNMRGLNPFLPVTAQIMISQIIGHDENDVRLCDSISSGTAKNERECESRQAGAGCFEKCSS